MKNIREIDAEHAAVMAEWHPHFEIDVPLVGADGNAFAILAIVKKALLKAGATGEQVAEFMDDATSGDYDHLLMVVSDWVNVV